MIDKLEVFRSQFPNAYFFDPDNLDLLPDYLKSKKLISKREDVLELEKPGEGNMNFVLRVVTEQKSFIIKQSRPWVEKYPQIEAPVERLKVEHTYYSILSGDPFFSSFSPKVLLYDPDNLILVTEDLGEGSDFSYCYQKSKSLTPAYLKSLLAYLNHLHHIDWGKRQNRFPSNSELKRLNHQHIFILPFVQDNGFDLDTIQAGLQELSTPFKNDEPLKMHIAKLGDHYLSSGSILIHGDYYPGSWLDINKQVKVIDPEFAYFGYPEFDLAVMVAHLLMTNIKADEVKNLLQTYDRKNEFKTDLFYGFCGCEILRRIIGLAQLPLELSLTEKKEFMQLAKSFIDKTHTGTLIN